VGSHSKTLANAAFDANWITKIQSQRGLERISPEVGRLCDRLRIELHLGLDGVDHGERPERKYEEAAQ